MSLKALYRLSLLMVDINLENKLSATDCYIVTHQINEITQEYTGNIGINNIISNKWGQTHRQTCHAAMREAGGAQ